MLWASTTTTTPARISAALLATDSHFFLLGGNNGTTTFNDVWRSGDGRNWNVVNSKAAWSARSAHGAVIVPTTGQVVLLGGRTESGAKSDVWVSADGCVSFTAHPAAPWAGRWAHAAVALPDGAIVVAGGTNGFGVYGGAWRSLDGGETWVPACYSCGWVARYAAGAAATQDGRIVLAGGWSTTTEALNDVWASSNGGDTWHRQTAAAPWAPRAGLAAVPFLGASVAVLGGNSTGGTLLNDVWLSADAGATWRLAESEQNADWAPRAFHAATVWTGGGNLVLVGGDTGTGDAADSWQGYNRWNGLALPCDNELPAMCGARPRSMVVTVALPAASGAVAPPNGAALALSLVYAPPVPSLEAVEVDATAGSWLVVASFSSRVTGVSAADFVFASTQGATVDLYSAVMGRQGAVWELMVVVGVITSPCPSAFTMLQSSTGDARYCARTIDTLGSWHDQNSACGPYSLATVPSATIANLTTSAAVPLVTPYWYEPPPNPGYNPPVSLLMCVCVRAACKQDWPARR